MTKQEGLRHKKEKAHWGAKRSRKVSGRVQALINQINQAREEARRAGMSVSQRFTEDEKKRINLIRGQNQAKMALSHREYIYWLRGVEARKKRLIKEKAKMQKELEATPPSVSEYFESDEEMTEEEKREQWEAYKLAEEGPVMTRPLTRRRGLVGGALGETEHRPRRRERFGAPPVVEDKFADHGTWGKPKESTTMRVWGQGKDEKVRTWGEGTDTTGDIVARHREAKSKPQVKRVSRSTRKTAPKLKVDKKGNLHDAKGRFVSSAKTSVSKVQKRKTIAPKVKTSRPAKKQKKRKAQKLTSPTIHKERVKTQPRGAKGRFGKKTKSEYDMEPYDFRAVQQAKLDKKEIDVHTYARYIRKYEQKHPDKKVPGKRYRMTIVVNGELDDPNDNNQVAGERQIAWRITHQTNKLYLTKAEKADKFSRVTLHAEGSKKRSTVSSIEVIAVYDAYTGKKIKGAES